MQGERKFGSMAGYSVAGSLIALVGTVILVGYFRMELAGALVGKCFYFAVLVVIFVFVLKAVLGKPQRRAVKEFGLMKKMVLPAFIFLAGTTVLFQVDKLFVRNFAPQLSGGYGAITTWGTLPLYFIAPLVFVVFPIASAEHAGGRSVMKFFRQAMAGGLIVTVACGIVFYAIGGFLMNILNEVYVPYAKYLGVYAVIMGFHGMIQIIASVEMARHRYSFLWFMTAGAFVMTGVLYFMRGGLTIPVVLTVLVITHLIVLVALMVFVAKVEPAADESSAKPT